MIINLDKFKPAGETEIIIQEVVKNEIDFSSIGYGIEGNFVANSYLQDDLSKSIDKQNEFNSRPNPETHDGIMANTDLRYLPTVDTNPIKDMESMFAGNTNAETVTEVVDFTGCTKADLVFDGCNNLKSVNMISGAGEVISAVGMFKDCWKLEVIVNIEFPSLLNAEAMFMNCYRLIGLNWFDTRSVTNFTGMFAFCSKDTPDGLFGFINKDYPLYMDNATSAIAMAEYSGIRELYIANIGNLNSTNRMFAGCSQLENLWILGSPGNFLSSNSKYNEMFYGPDDPTDCFDNLTIHLDETYDWTVFTDFLTSINIKYEMFNSSDDNPDDNPDNPFGTDTYGNPNEAIPVTIAEFTSAEPDTNQWYELTGEIKAMPVMETGTIIIQDDTGVAFIDGTVDSPKLELDESFMNTGASDYDIITLRTRRLEGMFNTADLGDYEFGEVAIGGGMPPAIYVSHIDK